MNVGIAAADAESPVVGERVVGVDESRVVFVLHIVGEVVDEQYVLERHVVVNVAGLFEEVHATDVIEPAIQGLAEQLDLFGPLELMLRIRDLLERLGRTVEVRADVPLDLTISGDRLQLQRVGHIVDARDRASERAS